MFPDPRFELKSTNYNKFSEGKKIASFDICLLALFDTDYTDDVWEEQFDMLEHYMNAPVAAFVNTVNERTQVYLPQDLADKLCANEAWDTTTDQA